MTRYTRRQVKVAVSIPDDIYSEADRIAARQGLNRSQLYARALRRYLDADRGDEITRRIDEVVGDVGGPADDLAPVAAQDLIDTGSWEW